MLVKTISTPSAGLRRFTLADGFDATQFGNITTAMTLTIQQGEEYTDESTILDLVAPIASTDAGNGTIDITLPDDASAFIGSDSLGDTTYLPIYVSGIHGFDYVAETQYWSPMGLNWWGYWEYIHMLFKINLLLGTAPSVTLGYESPIAGAIAETTITMSDNSGGNFQVWTALRAALEATEGQSLKMKFSGTHNGHEWMLQYLGADIKTVVADNLMRFEG